jgi:peptidoglycan/LPS O-acetylase OafA/YrhL
VAWSLCVEVSFYLLLPFLARGIARLARDRDPAGSVRLQLRLLCSLAAASLALRLALTGSPFLPVPRSEIVPASTLPWLFDWFAIGMFLAVLASDWETGSLTMPRLAGLAARPWVCWLLAAEVFTFMIIVHGDFYLPQYSLLAHLAFGALGALIVLPAAGSVRSERRTPAIGLLCSAPVVWLGTISYGIYLWHVPVLDAIRGPFEGVTVHSTGAATAIATTVLAAAITVAIAAASWYLVEQPAQRLFRGRRTPALAPARA